MMPFHLCTLNFYRVTTCECNKIKIILVDIIWNFPLDIGPPDRLAYSVYQIVRATTEIYDATAPTVVLNSPRYRRCK